MKMLRELLVNPGNVCWVGYQKIGDKVSVCMEFLNGEKKHFVVRELDWMDLRREFKRKGLVEVKKLQTEVR